MSRLLNIVLTAFFLFKRNKDVYNQIAKDYGISSFNGDINQMLCDMWTKNKKNWIQFSKEAIEYLETV